MYAVLAILCVRDLMAKTYSDDLRRRFLSAYEQGEGTLDSDAARRASYWKSRESSCDFG
jgi:hypothetical protein